MFDLVHILYMVISAIISAALLVTMHKILKTEDQKNRGLKFFALITVFIHYSSLWVEFFKEGSAEIGNTMLLAPYPCNVCMWLLVISAFVKKRDNIAYRLLSEFTFWGGTVCGFIGILLNENYDSTPSLLDYEVLKGLLSHSTMIIGCIYLAVSGIVKIRVKNTLSVAAGLMLFLLDGLFVNTLYKIFDLGSCNSMYLEEAPFVDLPWINTLTLGLMGLAAAFIITAIYEQIFIPKNERWYAHLKQKINLLKKK